MTNREIVAWCTTVFALLILSGVMCWGTDTYQHAQQMMLREALKQAHIAEVQAVTAFAVGEALRSATRKSKALEAEVAKAKAAMPKAKAVLVQHVEVQGTVAGKPGTCVLWAGERLVLAIDGSILTQGGVSAYVGVMAATAAGKLLLEQPVRSGDAKIVMEKLNTRKGYRITGLAGLSIDGPSVAALLATPGYTLVGVEFQPTIGALVLPGQIWSSTFLAGFSVAW